MARGFAKVSEEEIEEAFFYPSDLVNTKTTIPLRVGEERWIYTSTLRVSVYIHHYSPPLRGIVVYYFAQYFERHGLFHHRMLQVAFSHLQYYFAFAYAKADCKATELKKKQSETKQTQKTYEITRGKHGPCCY